MNPRCLTDEELCREGEDCGNEIAAELVRRLRGYKEEIALGVAIEEMMAWKQST